MDVRTRKYLVDQGVMTTDRVTRRPVPRTCRRCGRAVISALADDGPDTTGVRVDLDPRPVTTLGEWQARLAGLGTFHITAGLVAWRDPTTITRRRAEDADVHHEHACNPPPVDYTPKEPK